MKILISGIHGFVALYLVKELKGNEIYGLDMIDTPVDGVEQIFTWKDLNEGKIPDVDSIIHLAEKGDDRTNIGNKQDYLDSNTRLTERIFDYFRLSSANRFIFFSSVKAAADSVNGEVLTEEVEPQPVGPYGESKIRAERYVTALTHDDQPQKVYILRPCLIHAPGNMGNMGFVYRIISRGFPWLLGAYDSNRSYTSIDNLCYVVKELLVKDVPSGVYQMADDTPIRNSKLIQLVGEATGHSPHIFNLPKPMLQLLACFCGWLHLPFTPKRLRKLTQNYVASNAKILKALGIQHLPTSAEEGIRFTLTGTRRDTNLHS